jgi:hypothetical protein
LLRQRRCFRFASTRFECCASSSLFETHNHLAMSVERRVDARLRQSRNVRESGRGAVQFGRGSARKDAERAQSGCLNHYTVLQPKPAASRSSQVTTRGNQKRFCALTKPARVDDVLLPRLRTTTHQKRRVASRQIPYCVPNRRAEASSSHHTPCGAPTFRGAAVASSGAHNKQM